MAQNTTQGYISVLQTYNSTSQHHKLATSHHA